VKIKERLKLNTWFSLGAVILMLLSLGWSFWEADQTDQNVLLMHETEKAVFVRIMLRDDWLLNREDRARNQWQAKTETLRKLLESASQRFTGKEAKDLLKDAREDFEASSSLFSIVLEKHKWQDRGAKKKFAFTEAESRVINQVFLKAYSLNDNISRLNEHARKAAIEARNRGIILIIIFIIGGITAMVLNSTAINRIVAKRLVKIGDGIKVIGDGNLDYRIDAEGDDELADLAWASNEMAAKLKKSYASSKDLQQEITERKKVEENIKKLSLRQQAFITAIPDIIMEVDTNKIYTWANEPGIDFFGKDVIGKEADFYFVREQNTYDAVQPIFNGNENVIYLESWQKRKDGQERLLAWWCRVLKDAQGNVTGALSSARDVTERKLAESQREALLEEIRKLNEELERRVIERTTQLEAVNKELETFSYSVSHDLRAPLRSIDGFSHALLEDYHAKLDEEGKNYLERIRKATQHMGNLIDDMLKLSRVTQSEFNYQSIDLSKMVQSISDTFQKNNPNNNVKMTIQKGIVIQGDPHSMQIALTNLIDNAWKFTGKQKDPRIEFGSTLKENEKIFFIRDNGVGFDMSYVGKLFGAFQRLHTMDEFAGTGIGLATVQRIIRRHGGKIWAEGEVGKGATFYFTLPA
jgi:hypothetical protein